MAQRNSLVGAVLRSWPRDRVASSPNIPIRQPGAAIGRMDDAIADDDGVA
jgi:hypothetical protein